MAGRLILNKKLLLVSDDGWHWKLVANPSTDEEIERAKQKVRKGVFLLVADREQITEGK